MYTESEWYFQLSKASCLLHTENPECLFQFTRLLALHTYTLKWNSTFSKDFSTLTDLRYSISSHITKEFLESFTELFSHTFSYQNKKHLMAQRFGLWILPCDIFIGSGSSLSSSWTRLPWIFSTDVARLSYFLSQAYSPDPVLCPYSCFPCFGGV